jgi:hypothetical protein
MVFFLVWDGFCDTVSGGLPPASMSGENHRLLDVRARMKDIAGQPAC